MNLLEEAQNLHKGAIRHVLPTNAAGGPKPGCYACSTKALLLKGNACTWLPQPQLRSCLCKHNQLQSAHHLQHSGFLSCNRLCRHAADKFMIIMLQSADRMTSMPVARIWFGKMTMEQVIQMRETVLKVIADEVGDSMVVVATCFDGEHAALLEHWINRPCSLRALIKHCKQQIGDPSGSHRAKQVWDNLLSDVAP